MTFTLGLSEVTVYRSPGASGSVCSSVPEAWSNATRIPSTLDGSETAGRRRPSSWPTVIRSSISSGAGADGSGAPSPGARLTGGSTRPALR